MLVRVHTYLNAGLGSLTTQTLEVMTSITQSNKYARLCINTILRCISGAQVAHHVVELMKILQCYA